MRALGLDGSKWIPEFNYQGNIDYFIQRLSYAQNIDERYEQRKEEIKDIPVKEGYHFYYMTHPWKLQVDLMLYLGDGYTALWWDAEELVLRDGTVINTFNDRFANETAEALRILQMENENNGLYCNRDIYYQLEAKLGASWLNNIPLWIADPHDNLNEEVFRLETEQPAWGVWRKNSEGWYLRKFDRPENTWTHWQVKFNGDPKKYGVVGKNAVDVDVFNGTFDDLLKRSGIENNKGCLELLKGLK